MTLVSRFIFFFRQRPLGIVVMLLLLTIWAVIATTHSASSPIHTGAWYYDLESGKVFVGPFDAVPPIATPSGHTSPSGENLGVRAIMFSCGNCADASKRYVGYLETISPEARPIILEQIEKEKAAAANGTAPDPPTYDPQLFGRLITKPDQTNWFPKDSNEGQKILPGPESKCSDGTVPRTCTPEEP